MAGGDFFRNCHFARDDAAEAGAGGAAHPEGSVSRGREGAEEDDVLVTVQRALAYEEAEAVLEEGDALEVSLDGGGFGRLGGEGADGECEEADNGWGVEAGSFHGGVPPFVGFSG